MLTRIAFAAALLSVAHAQEPTPVFSAAGVVNAATFTPGLTPGGLATVFGTGLTTNVNGIIRAAGFPMPANLQGTMLLIDGVAAPLTSIANVNGTEQINFQTPFESAANDTVVLQVRNGQSLSGPVAVPVLPFQPGMFTSDGRRGIIVHGADYSLVTPGNPAARGEVVVAFATGLGPVTPRTGTGVAASPLFLTFTANPVTVSFGTAAVMPLFAGLTPGFAGLFQINVRVPAAAPSGDIPVTLTVAGTTSPSVLLAVQ